MADYDKLIKTLQICGSLSSCEGCPRFKSGELSCYIQLKQEAADAIEELEEKAQALAETLYAYEHPWIPLSSALPEDGSDILAVQSYCGEVRIIPANYDRGVWYDCVYNRRAENITHWMPVPQPPTEGSQMVTDSNQVQEEEK